MKFWSSFPSASFLLGTVIAADSVHQVTEPTKYRLMITTHGAVRDIDDNYLSSDEEGNVGIFTTDREPLLIHDIMPGNKSDSLVFFDTRPGDELFHGLSLLGWKGNMRLRNTLHPNGFRVEKPTDIYTPDTYSWNEFWLAEGSNGMKELLWGSKGEHPGWPFEV
ncbi:hypothetical protein N0V84_008737 [Fusarium piperis]|uniref:Uncharacterized protein n=1 Tax=Fusarium piperis TaxID=1435070 RepID=A0A9W8W7N2_9HYPO|nr:hypothetical protein N0V84_008737 [Fusarium piperis]